MSDASGNEVIIAPPYTPIGLGPADWTLVEPGLFDYPIPEGTKPSLIGSQCIRCDRTFFPRRALCPDCFDQDNMEIKRLNSRGIIYSSTVVRIPSPVGIKPPYAYGYVDILTDNIRVYALFAGNDFASLAVGKEVELVIEPFAVNKQGQKVIGYKFKLVE
jgi:uncharacterized OB-fold protein